MIFLWIQLESEQIIDCKCKSFGQAREDVGYESEEDHETAEEKKLRLAKIYLQVKDRFTSCKLPTLDKLLME